MGICSVSRSTPEVPNGINPPPARLPASAAAEQSMCEVLTGARRDFLKVGASYFLFVCLFFKNLQEML